MGVFCGLALLLASRAVVIVPVANMHSRASTDADVVSQARYGTTVQITEETEGWARIQTPDEYLGWAQTPALRTLKQDEPDYASSGKIASVESLFAHIFREPSGTKHPPLLTVPFESRLESITEEANDDGRWLSVRLPDDRHGWIRRGDITFDVQAVTIPEVIRLAKRFLGLPYTWGGTTSYGYDCSGYTQMLCRRAGVNLPRDAAPQFHWRGMKPVERTDILPGDLIFFGRNKEKPSHVGMYIGDGEFIHTSAWEHPVLQVSRLSEEHWTRLYIGARRWKP